MKIRVTWLWWTARGRYAIRIRGEEIAAPVIAVLRTRGAKVNASRRVDTRLLIDAADMRKRGGQHDRRTDRGDRAALKFAEEIEREVLEEAEHATTAAGDGTSRGAQGTPTLAALWSLYEELNRSRVRPATLRRNRNQAQPLIRYFDEILALAPGAITVAKAERYVAWRLEQGRSPRTVWGEIAFLGQLLGWAVDRADESGLTAIALRKLPQILGKRGSRRRKAMLTATQFFMLFHAAQRLPRRGDVLRRIIALGGCARLRKTPLLALDGAWIDRRRAWLTIPAKYNKGRGDDYREISVPLPRFAMAQIEDLPTDGLLWPSMFQRAAAASADALIAAVPTIDSDDVDRDQLLVALTKRYRVRIADVVSLGWDQVNVQGGWIDGLRCRGKVDAAERVHLEAEDAERLVLLHARRGGDLVFKRRGEQPFTPAAVLHVHERLLDAVPLAHAGDARPMTMNNPRSLWNACDLAGIPRITPHDLRRTGNHILEAHRCPKHPSGVAKEIRERLLGHSQPALDAAYSLITEAMLREAVDVYDEEYEAFCKQLGIIDLASRRAEAS